jgi:hypothetical protein
MLFLVNVLVFDVLTGPVAGSKRVCALTVAKP